MSGTYHAHAAIHDAGREPGIAAFDIGLASGDKSHEHLPNVQKQVAKRVLTGNMCVVYMLSLCWRYNSERWIILV